MKSKLLHLLCGALAVSSLAGCGVMSLDEEAVDSNEASLSMSPSPSPAPAVTCVTDSMGLCTPETGGQACTTSDGRNGTCTSTASGCTCLANSVSPSPSPTAYPYPSPSPTASPYPSPSPTPYPSPSPSPAPGFVTCKTDSLGACTSDTAGQSCKKSDGSTGTCTSTYSGCGCV